MDTNFGSHMKDQEVGELWREVQGTKYSIRAGKYRAIICKLVEQRAIARWYANRLVGDSLSRENITFALECFNIKPEEWE